MREDNLFSYLSLYKISTFDLLIEDSPPRILMPQTTHAFHFFLCYFYLKATNFWLLFDSIWGGNFLYGRLGQKTKSIKESMGRPTLGRPLPYKFCGDQDKMLKRGDKMIG